MILRLVESSGLYSLGATRALADFRNAVTTGPAVAGFTETEGRHQQLRKVRGYRAVTFKRAGEVSFLIRDDVQLLRKGKRRIGKIVTGRTVWIVWVKVRIGSETVYVHLAHWPAGVETHMGRNSTSSRLKAHIKTTRRIARLTNRHGRGRALSFFMGDINVNQHRDKGTDHRFPRHILHAQGLVTVWQTGAKKLRTSGTHAGGRAIDVIGHRRRDGRVSLVQVYVHPRRNSDHRAVEAVYEVKP